MAEVRGRRLGTRWLLAAGIAVYVLAVTAALGMLLVSGEIVALAIAAALALAGLVVLVAHLVGRYTSALRRLAADTWVVVAANPDHRVDETGPVEVAELAAAVRELAQRRRDAEQAVDEQIAAAQADLEEERNRLAAVMAELGAAVLVCNVEGRILLYNTAARALLGDDGVVGLGRSVFGIVDRDLLTHAMDRIADSAGESSHVSTALRGEQLLQVHTAPARGSDGTVTGYVLILEDLTERVSSSTRRGELLRELTEATRSSLGSIQAAIENVLEYPDMDSTDRSQFLEIVREECQRLGRRVHQWVDESGDDFGANWPTTEMSVEDLLAVVARAVEHDAGIAVSRRAGTGQLGSDPLWVRADSHSVMRALTHLTARIAEWEGIDTLALSAERVGRHVRIELGWAGRTPTPADFQSWLGESLPGVAAASTQEVVARHGGEIWCESVGNGERPADTLGARLLLLLPVTTPARTRAAPPRPEVVSRPEFYDFGLFERHAGSQTGDDRDLGALSYTVFDTETTGLDPEHGDRIVSIGAVRVVNGRLLHTETFERLVDPQRAVPAASTAVHGITTAMVRGQPTIETVLPEFDRFCADTILVGHNVGFDMQFLRLERARAQLSSTRPVVLDTLLLDAAAHPDHDEHSLEAIANRLGVDVLGRHTALGDALVTGEVFTRLVVLLAERGVRTLGEAVAASRATLQARLDKSFYGS